MAEQIKKVDKIFCDEKLIEQFVENIAKDKVAKYIEKINETISIFLQEFSSKSWIKIPDKNIYYNHDIGAVFPDLEFFDCGCCYYQDEFIPQSFQETFYDFSGKLMTPEEAKLLFIDKLDNNPFISDGNIFSGDDSFQKISLIENKYMRLCGGNVYDFGEIDEDCDSDDNDYSLHIPHFSLNIPENATQCDVLLILFKNDILSDEFKLVKLLEEKHIQIENNKVVCTQKLYDDVLQGKVILDEPFDKNSIIEDLIKGGTAKLLDKRLDLMQKKLLDCDKIRADIESYDEKILTDHNRGHWDLWDEVQNTKGIPVNVELDLWARNPIADIKEHGVIGIDFGTKSTVVVYQSDNEHTLPMRVGIGQYSKNPERHHYENPTVIEFINIKNFLSAYGSKKGRPDTLWEDITISHTAFNKFNQSSSEEYNSFFYELKQWAGDKKRLIRLKDKQNYSLPLKPYLEISETDPDPIEIYAYYIGLYINNMTRGGNIYLDYIMSFPVTYETAVREKIIKSFEKGIKKSLPESLLNDDETMKKFRIIKGASEPAAYAVCALTEYKFEPEGDDQIFYGVFDFGGGTTDFDFGIWREPQSTDASERRFDYVITHFGSGGDKYLGGENLLELLAYEVFKENQENLRKDGIVFSRPPECKSFIGDEMLVNSSQEAKSNMKQLAEKLRPLWEKHEGYEKTFESGSIKVNLFDKNGNSKLNSDLNINKKMLEQIISNRIEKGVQNFFEALKLAFNFPQTKYIDEVNIFLAGNASKSPIVKELFEKYIIEETKTINEINGEDKEFFRIYPPLGTDEALKLQEGSVEEGTKIESLTMPTGKTGVAFGLIKSRTGGKIKVEDRNILDSEIKFKYFIGYCKKEKFKIVINREIKYNKWEWFIDAGHEDFELYYTDLPEASTMEMHISKVSRKRCRIEKSGDKDARVYIRITGPTTIEYVVSTPNNIARENFSSEVKKIELD